VLPEIQFDEILWINYYESGDGVHPITAFKADNSCKEKLSQAGVAAGINSCGET
jgi:hypothetical protein